MEIPSIIDTDVISNPMYWLLTAGAEFALLLVFKLQGSWSAGSSMPLTSKLITLALVTVASYVIALKMSR